VNEIIEIPVFKTVDNEENPLFKGQEYLKDKTYEGFRFLEYPLTETQSVYFYVIELSLEQNNRYLWDRIIPKAPCCIYLYDNDEKSINRFFQDYGRYKTPLFLIAPKDSEIPENVLEYFKGNVVYFEESSENYFRRLLKEIFEKLLETAE
jgi:hypothetical protein